MPVLKILKDLKRGKYAKHIQKGAAVYCAASLEYLVAELVELAGQAARDNKKKRIIPRHLLLAIRNDDELNNLLGDVTIPEGGTFPYIHPSLLPIKTRPKESSSNPSAAGTSGVKR